MRTLWIVGLLALCSCTSQAPEESPMSEAEADPEPSLEKIEKPDAEWRNQLTDQQFAVTRGAGTERAFTGTYWDHHADGTYLCVCCKLPLFDSTTKFDSGTGWPSFFAAVDERYVRRIEDRTHGMLRTEVVCARCDAHLGHVFPDGPKPTGERFCMNSASLDFRERP